MKKKLVILSDDGSAVVPVQPSKAHLAIKRVAERPQLVSKNAAYQPEYALNCDDDMPGCSSCCSGS